MNNSEKTKLVVAVEWRCDCDDEIETTEIFDNIKDAEIFAREEAKDGFIRAFICDAKHAFYEEDGALNYDDFSDTFNNIIEIDLV